MECSVFAIPWTWHLQADPRDHRFLIPGNTMGWDHAMGWCEWPKQGRRGQPYHSSIKRLLKWFSMTTASRVTCHLHDQSNPHHVYRNGQKDSLCTELWWSRAFVYPNNADQEVRNVHIPIWELWSVKEGSPGFPHLVKYDCCHLSIKFETNTGNKYKELLEQLQTFLLFLLPHLSPNLQSYLN